MNDSETRHTCAWLTRNDDARNEPLLCGTDCALVEYFVLIAEVEFLGGIPDAKLPPDILLQRQRTMRRFENLIKSIFPPVGGIDGFPELRPLGPAPSFPASLYEIIRVEL